MSAPKPAAPRVALFVTCLVDAMRPRVGFAAVSLLEAAGCVVRFPAGRPAAGSRRSIPAIMTAQPRWRGARSRSLTTTTLSSFRLAGARARSPRITPICFSPARIGTAARLPCSGENL